MSKEFKKLAVQKTFTVTITAIRTRKLKAKEK